jgi:putative mRNA 3-end processing factor
MHAMPLGCHHPAPKFIAMPHPETWLKPVAEGLYCEPGGFYVDPVRPVDRAVITHAHSDHARPGHAAVLATPETLAIMRVRMGEDRAGATQQALAYGAPLTIGEVRVWLEPAGHVLGSAQVAMEWRGSRAVVSGDYKRTADPTCAPFVPIPCDVFVTEATFALPVCSTASPCSPSAPTSSAPTRSANASG